MQGDNKIFYQGLCAIVFSILVKFEFIFESFRHCNFAHISYDLTKDVGNVFYRILYPFKFTYAHVHTVYCIYM